MKNFKMLMVGCSKTSMGSSIDTSVEESITAPTQEQIAEPEEIPDKLPSLLKDDEDYDIDDELRDAMNLAAMEDFDGEQESD